MSDAEGETGARKPVDSVDGAVGDGPAIILVEPQMGENIGGAARAMLNFGLTDLRLAAPRDGWPNEKALTMAAGAKRVVAEAKLFDTAAQSVSDLHFVVATTARRRDITLPVAAPREAVAALREKRAAGLACGVLFGAERAGLTTDQVALADMIVTMPVNPEFGSLNLAQAVGVLAYEWGVAETASAAPLEAAPMEAAPPTKAELEGLAAHLETALSGVGYFFPEEKRPVMERHLRALLTRAAFTAADVQTLRGVVKALAEGRRRARDGDALSVSD